MLAFIVALLFVFADAQQPTGYPTVPLAEFDCSKVDDPSIDRFYPNPNDCNKFYRCVPGHLYAYLYTCADPNEVFDETMQMCVNTWDTYPPCGTKQSTTSGAQISTNVPPTADPNGFYCDNLAPGYYPNPNSCSSFYICNADVPAGATPTPVPCPAGLVYNPDMYYCDWPYNVAPPCGTKVTFAVRAEGPACEDYERYDCNGATSIVVDSDCTTYYNCDANIQKVCPSTCPAGLVFNAAAGYCDWPFNVAPPCGTKTYNFVPLVDTTGPACADNERYDCNGATTIVRDPKDCSKFYNCDAQIQRPCPSVCPDGLFFDPSEGVCNYPDQVIC